MAHEKKRMTTKEEEEKLKRRNKENAPNDEVKEYVPPDSPPSKQAKYEADRGKDVRRQKSEKRQLHNESED